MQIDERKIDALFTQLDQCHLPGAAVGIAIGGRPVYRKGFGLANMELPIVLSPAIRMRIGSTTKHFAALAYMLLCEEGRAAIDDPLSKYLPELHPVTHRVTLHQLMGNIGGLRDACDISLRLSGAGRRVTSAELLELYRDIDDVNAAPGTAWIYNNGGYLLLSVVIERITGQALEDVLRERIFGPVGMHDTLLRRFDTDFVPNSAIAHMKNPAGAYEKAYYGIDFAGAGAMVSTVDDLLRWLAHMDVPVVGSPATWEIMKTPQVLRNGTSTGYGLGLMSGNYRGVTTLSHPGGGMGSNAQMLKVPSAGLDVVVIVNRQDIWAPTLANAILDACLPDLDALQDVPQSPCVCGVFRSRTTGRIAHLFAKDEQQIVSMDAFDLPFVRAADGLLRPAPVWNSIKRSIAVSGDPRQPATIRLDDFGNVDELTRVGMSVRTSAGTFVGRYRSDSTGSDVAVHETERGLQLITKGRFGSALYDLECLAEGIWRAKPASAMTLGGVVSFDADRAGLHFHTYGTRSLPFRRCD